MIAPLRRRHLWMVALLAPTLVILVVLGLSARPSLPLEDRLESPFVSDRPEGGQILMEQDDFFPGLGLRARVREIQSSFVLELAPSRPLGRPDVLVYHSTDEVTGESLPASAIFLGALADSRPRFFRLPAAAGTLILYSLGHGQVVATATLGAGPRSSTGEAEP